uniref:Uncharacterized protein n=1 Tax=Arundo donax TaxID=35708 RepID=A0A0A9H0D2_ARUDO
MPAPAGGRSSAARCGAGMGRSLCRWSQRRRRGYAEGTPRGTRRGRGSSSAPGCSTSTRSTPS